MRCSNVTSIHLQCFFGKADVLLCEIRVLLHSLFSSKSLENLDTKHADSALSASALSLVSYTLETYLRDRYFVLLIAAESVGALLYFCIVHILIGFLVTYLVQHVE